MLPYTAAAMYTNQLQAAAMSYHQHQNSQRAPSPSNPSQLAAISNFERFRYGFSALQSPPGVMVPASVNGGGGMVGPNQAQGGSPIAGGYPPAMFQHAAAAAAAAAAFDPMTLAAAGFRHAAFDPRTGRFLPPEEPKPQHSYIGLIAMAILSNGEKKMVLSDIYQWILDHYPYFRTRGPGWRNSIRHNLSLNDCFIKAGRSANGKGHYWAIHPANVEDFKKGDFRRRRAQRKVRKHMGLSVPDDEDDSDDSPCSSPTVAPNNFFLTASNGTLAPPTAAAVLASLPAVRASIPQNLTISKIASTFLGDNDRSIGDGESKIENGEQTHEPKRKRLFDMDSLLSSSKLDDKQSALDCSTAKRTRLENETECGAGANAKSPMADERQQPLGIPPNPFFFPQPLPHNAATNPENGSIFAAMAAAAAAGFMPFAFMPHTAAAMQPTAGLPWNFAPNSNIAPGVPLPTFLPGHQQPYFWQFPAVPPNAACSTSPQSASKTASSSTTPTSTIGNGDCGGPGNDNHSHGQNHEMLGNLGKSDPVSASVTRSPSPQDTAAQWQETFAKIMARSYQGRGFLKGHSSKGASQLDEMDEITSKSPKPLQN